MIRWLLASILFVLSVPAPAEWREAQSRNFIVYSQTDERRLRQFTEKLEKFDQVLRLVHNVDAPPSPNRLRVFLLPDTGAVADMAGAPGGGIAGYYIADARGVMMVGTHSRPNGRNRIDAESILLHEYTHHFMYRYFPATYPAWYSEGFAEFWGSTKFLENNVVEIGHPAEHRFGSVNPQLGFMNMARWLPVDRLLTARSYADVPELDLLYSEGWLLVRYAWENPERNRQLQQYLQLINDGVSYEDAMNRAFGEGARSLNSELYEYAGRERFSVVRLPFRELDPGQITFRTVSPAEQALMEYEIKLSQGVPQQRFPDFASDLRRAAGRFPYDPFALQLLAEVERIANNHAAAMAATDRLLQVDPDNARGLVHRAMLQVDALRAANSTDRESWNEARRLIRRAARLRPSDPIPLEAYYDSYAAQGVLPPVDAQQGLHAALDLAPSDNNLRYKVASDFEQRDMIAEAIAVIRSDAHRLPDRNNESERERRRRERLEDRYRRAGNDRRETAREMMERLEQKLAQAQAGDSRTTSRN